MNSKITTLSRIVLGIVLIAFGANKYLNFMPGPEGASEGAINFMNALIETGYLWKFIGVIEVFSGALVFILVVVLFSVNWNKYKPLFES